MLPVACSSMANRDETEDDFSGKNIFGVDINEVNFFENLEFIKNPFEGSDAYPLPDLDELMLKIRNYRENSSQEVDCTTPTSVDGTSFRWSIDQVARILPADINYQIQEDCLTIFKPTDSDAQRKIDEYFSTLCLPSPFTPNNRKISNNVLSPCMDDSEVPMETYLSHGAFNTYQKYAKEAQKKTNEIKPHKIYKTVSCQTDISVPFSTDLFSVLNMRQNENKGSCMVLNSTQLNNAKETPCKNQTNIYDMGYRMISCKDGCKNLQSSAIDDDLVNILKSWHISSLENTKLASSDNRLNSNSDYTPLNSLPKPKYAQNKTENDSGSKIDGTGKEENFFNFEGLHETSPLSNIKGSPFVINEGNVDEKNSSPSPIKYQPEYSTMLLESKSKTVESGYVTNNKSTENPKEMKD